MALRQLHLILMVPVTITLILMVTLVHSTTSHSLRSRKDDHHSPANISFAYFDGPRIRDGEFPGAEIRTFRSDTPTPISEGSTRRLSRALVVPRMKGDDVAWIAERLVGLDLTVYLANDASSQLHPPKNKGHEAAVYLTYIIDHYEELPDIIIFMHAHRHTHHNNDLLDHDAALMVKRLQAEKVLRNGYFNMRCRWKPGCPSWLSSEFRGEALKQQEQAVLSESWLELYPGYTIPATLAQACCAQFAVSSEQILSIPRSRFVFFRDWLMKTPLSNYFSGRIFEYTWQYLFTGKGIHCPTEHSCYCEGYGVCSDRA